MLSTIKSYSQIDSIMGVTGIAQMKSNWCWAACTEMILKKHNPNNLMSQCSLGLKNYNTLFTPLLTNCDKCNVCYPTVTPRDKCNRGVDDALLTKIFNDISFKASSSIDSVGFSFPWAKIKNQIDSAKPFIVTIQFDTRLTCESNHAVVGYGIDGNQIQYLNPKNPNSRCSSRIEKIPYNNTPSSTLGKPCRFIYSIQPNVPILAPPPIQPLMARVSVTAKSVNVINSFKGEVRNKISNKQLKVYRDSSDYLVIPVKFISHSTLLKDSSRTLTLNDITIKKQFVDIIYTKSPYTVTTMQKKCGKWFPILITHFEKDINLKTKIDSINIVLNKKDINSNGQLLDFIVKSPELGYEFFEAKNNSQSYLIPFSDYPNLENGENDLKEGVPYKVNVIINGLQKETKSQFQNTVSLKFNGVEKNNPKFNKSKN